jgi:hypothetical protein
MSILADSTLADLTAEQREIAERVTTQYEPLFEKLAHDERVKAFALLNREIAMRFNPTDGSIRCRFTVRTGGAK